MVSTCSSSKGSGTTGSGWLCNQRDDTAGRSPLHRQKVMATNTLLASIRVVSHTRGGISRTFAGTRSNDGRSPTATTETPKSGLSNKAFACRSTRRPPWRLGWRTNPLLLAAGATELVVALLMLYTGVAAVLGQAPPGTAGWAVALAAVGALLLVDASWKAWRARIRRREGRA